MYTLYNARLLDCETGNEKLCDVTVNLGKIEAVTPACGKHDFAETAEAIDLKGDYLFSGLIDYHTHLFAHGSTFGMDADKLFSAGVTCAVDMGSAGWVNHPALYACDIAPKKPLLKTYLNISPVGQPGKGINEPLDDSVLLPDKMAERIQEYPGVIRGLKVRISKGIVKELGLEPLRRAVEFGKALHLPVCVHTTNPPETAAATVKILRPGDIYSHTYHGSGNTIIGPDGHVYPEVLAAQKQGLIMEVGNGLKNFSFPVALQALQDGLLPDIISSDATPATFHKKPAMWDLTYVMSKFLNMGVPLARVIKAVTITPAQVLGLDHCLGTIAPGMDASFAVCRIVDANPVFEDSDGVTFPGTKVIVPLRTIFQGTTVYQADANTVYPWKK